MYGARAGAEGPAQLGLAELPVRMALPRVLPPAQAGQGGESLVAAVVVVVW